MAHRRISNAEIARETNLSATYIAERLRDEKSFTLTDMEELARFFGFDATEFLVEANAVRTNVTELRPRVGGSVDDGGTDQEQWAAGSDRTEVGPEDVEP